MQGYIRRGTLQVAEQLDRFINDKALPGTGIDQDTFWHGVESILTDLTPINSALLAKRERLQSEIDDYCADKDALDADDYRQFLTNIGYLQPEPDAFTISTDNVDPEIATMPGPQLVVPINNARYALNAANARWGSLYDAAYGTDVIGEDGGAEMGKGYNPVRGDKVIGFAKSWLDKIAPLQGASHKQVTSYQIVDGSLSATLGERDPVTLASAGQLVGYTGAEESPTALLLEHNGIHVEIQIDRTHPIGKTDTAGVKDVLMEAALTTIMDCEDSVAAVDAEDKTLVYENWYGLINGTLSVEMNKGGNTLIREMNPDRTYTAPDGSELVLPGRSLMFVRNVGHLMRNPAMLLNDEPVFEGLMDGIFTSLISKHDLLGNGRYINSKTGSIYIVKPKMHGPEEVAFTRSLFERAEALLGLAPNTIKMGIMDEERRTTVNLKACIAEAKERVVFINTGFLDRTGDEIHTSMLLGPFAPKAELKQRPWIHAYEKANVINGLSTGMSGKAQIGKGMWPIPDQMDNMMATKIGHPKAGANTAWVPSPTAATLHALHYHEVDVFAVQRELAEQSYDGLQDILDVPLLDRTKALSEEDIQRELDNNVQGILGYVVRWVHQGVGCSKVPDINNVGLMEDRATLRISSQHIANWLEHGIVTEQQVRESMQRMAGLVDEQNAGDPEYIAMTPDTSSAIGFLAAEDLIFKGKEQPSGYTEPVLHARRLEMKAKLAS
ncbi:malate synthase G [Aestuariibacter salexigens]|uniref:malate synthase G n=1 Tax=Aestuariibacter salexigens TaxID=226010 RepID=UPI00041736CC|nr:malate synthase G [Aestuariibacter salexigens]